MRLCGPYQGFVQSHNQYLFYIYQRDGFYAVWCDTNNLAQLQTNLYLWYYLFYLSKFYEFIDTVLLIAAKVSPSPLNFSHCAHQRNPSSSCTGSTTSSLRSWSSTSWS